MKILAFTDPHGSLASALSIIKLTDEAKPDLVVCAGDFSYLGSRIDGFLTKLKELGREILFVPGNHETEDTLSNVQLWYPYMKSVQSQVLDVGEYSVGGLPATQEFYPGQPFEEDVVPTAISTLSEGSQKPLVLLSHFPPTGTAICGMTDPTPDSGGSEPVRQVVAALEPALVISGHYHQDFGKFAEMGRTKLVNPGPDGMIIEI